MNGMSKHKQNWYLKAIYAIQHDDELDINPFIPLHDTINLDHLDITTQVGAALSAMGRLDILDKVARIELVTTRERAMSMLWYDHDDGFTDDDAETIWTALSFAVAAGGITVDRCDEAHFHLIGPEDQPDIEDTVAEFTKAMEDALGPSIRKGLDGDPEGWDKWL
jgi:hypothetical protein